MCFSFWIVRALNFRWCLLLFFIWQAGISLAICFLRLSGSNFQNTGTVYWGSDTRIALASYNSVAPLLLAGLRLGNARVRRIIRI